MARIQPLCNECQQHTTDTELEQSDNHITLTLERPITPGDLERAYCKLEAECK